MILFHILRPVFPPIIALSIVLVWYIWSSITLLTIMFEYLSPKVVMMTAPGIMLFYSGGVRIENVLATAMQSFSMLFLITLLWTFVG